MTPEQQRFEIAQIFAECQAKGWPMQLACLASAQWFDQRDIKPPVSLLDWLAEVPQDQWHAQNVH